MAKDTCQVGNKRLDTVFNFPGVQNPVAVIGLSCRLPGCNNSPTALWEFLKRGECARTEPPESRFNLKGHNDASKKPKTMRAPGGMFLENIDPRDIDAQFFSLSQVYVETVEWKTASSSSSQIRIIYLHAQRTNRLNVSGKQYPWILSSVSFLKSCTRDLRMLASVSKN